MTVNWYGDGMVAPDVQAIITCDRAERDPKSGKLSLIGLFSAVGATAFPTQVEEMCLFVSFTSVRGGQSTVGLQLVCLDSEDTLDDKIIAAGGALVKAESPNMIVESAIPLGSVVFPEPGDYEFRITCNGERIAYRPLTVKEIKGE
jgi:hypothetical protein